MSSQRQVTARFERAEPPRARSCVTAPRSAGEAMPRTTRAAMMTV
jgi:hypothetical protein